MDLHAVETWLAPTRREQLPAPSVGDALLGGGTWLFSEPQAATRLIDLMAFGWPPIERDPSGLVIAATCTLAELERCELETGWTGLSVFRPCVRSLWGSFKVIDRATVGGNLCLALPAAPMSALLPAFDGVCEIWKPSGETRHVTALDFVLGPRRTVLQPGEILRAIQIPASALSRRAAIRQASLTHHGRSAALAIGTRDGSGAFAVTLSAATIRPLQLRFKALPEAAELDRALDALLSPDLLHDDEHGAPGWRRMLSRRLAQQLRRELSP